MSEHQEQKALIEWARLTSPFLPELRILYAIPNGGERNRIVAARLKAEGVLPGIPDLCLPIPRGGFHSLYIELKDRGPRRNPSPVQQERIQVLRDYGHCVEVCRGWDQAKGLILRYLAEEVKP